uniref:Uncharacterized protein n=1 Tax=Onchocerca volvulus TaxID=6282 RepID=A0A8R1XVQ8_ONCVO
MKNSSSDGRLHVGKLNPPMLRKRPDLLPISSLLCDEVGAGWHWRAMVKRKLGYGVTVTFHNLREKRVSSKVANNKFESGCECCLSEEE